MTNGRIEGKVAQLLNPRELVINRGSDHGVTRGMVFAVINPRGAEITDPDTGDVLGSVEVPKVLVKVARVEPAFAVARTFVSKRRNVGGMGIGGVGRLFDPPKWQEVPETLRSDEKMYVEQISEAESYVKIGDPVVQARGEEFITDAVLSLGEEPDA